MMSLINTIPVTVKVTDPPLSAPLIDRGLVNSVWTKWFGLIGSWFTKSQEIKSGKLTLNGSIIGDYLINRTGSIVTLQGTINAGNYVSINVLGMPIVKPGIDTLVNTSIGVGKITVGGQFILTASSVEQILFNASYLAK